MDDRLGALADWWGSVSTRPAPDLVLVWPSPGLAGDATVPPICAATLTAPGGDPPAGAAEAQAWGTELADRAVDGGADLLVLSLPAELPGNGPGRDDAPGAAELPVHALLAAHLLELDPTEATEWPAGDGLTELAWAARVGSLRDGRRSLRGVYASDPDRLLELLDGRWLAAGFGLLSRAADRRTPVLLAGAASAACALLVRRTDSTAREWWQVADSGDALHDRVLADLRLPPLLRLGLDTVPRNRFRGVGGRLALAVLEAALAERS